MRDGSRGETARRLHQLLETEGPAVRESTTTFNAGKYDRLRELDDPGSVRDRARAIKEDAIERLPALLEELTDAIEANGGHVHLADDAAEATRYVRSILATHDAEVVVKSKSMTTEEIDLNGAIEADGIDVWETDLGEFIVQLADESPSHITAPAIHRSQTAIAELFEAHFDPAEPLTDAEALTRFARAVLTEHITEADVGITGANFIAADSGTIALVTSEGNARKCVATPPVHVAVAGVEKVIPSVADLEPFVELLARSAIGQDVSAYLSLFTPPIETPVPDFDAPDEPIAAGGVERDFHLVLLDNGRFDLREDDDLRETLYCIRCSACANSCANFQHVGGHAFGGETYSGGIATGWETGVHGIESAATFNDLCTGCTRCAPNCPVKIDIPWINTVVRDRLNRSGPTGWAASIYRGLRPDDVPGGVTRQQRAVANVDRALAIAHRLAPLSNVVVETQPVRLLLEHAIGIDRRRSLPTVSDERFTSWASERMGDGYDDTTVVFYPDIYTEYIRPERGRDAVRLLEALGETVAVVPAIESGRAPLSQGLIKPARTRARRLASAFEPALDANRDVIVIEPSDLGMFRREYGRLLPEATARRVGTAAYDLLEYVAAREELMDQLRRIDATGRVVYHPHCQARTLGVDAPTVATLEAAGFEVVPTTAECCGMAGSFGFKSQYYELSMAVGASLADEVAALDGDIIAASGTSCLDQLEAVTDAEPVHPVVLLADALEPARSR